MTVTHAATSEQTLTLDAAAKQKRAGLRRHIARQVILEIALPIGGYYVLRGMGVGPWLALIAPALITLPFLIYDAVRHRRLDTAAAFTLAMIVLATVMAMITGDPRTLMVRDSWIFGFLGLWALGSVFTQQPFMRITARAVVTAKIGEAGYREWDARWDTDSRFRYHLRVLSGVWGAGFLLDTIIRVSLAYTLPLDSIPLVTTLQWLVVLAILITFHVVYITRHDLKA
ncbi:VC0807 family protein [Nocardia sp. NPDC088792]|uniref:VC0807 family protein n=1 Tax=Nocardia sp. NPDC088792 TaxID=3364332 RepID=UPI0038265BCC